MDLGKGILDVEALRHDSQRNNWKLIGTTYL